MERNSINSIFIATSSFDQSTWEPVATHLHERGYETVIYEADKVANGMKDFNIHIGRTGITVNYLGNNIDFDNISASWYRRPNIFSPWLTDKSKQIALDNERKDIQESIWNLIEERKWLNSPQHIHRAEQKLSQLALANSLGFEIPITVSTNKWDEINEYLPNQIILKMSKGVLYEGDAIKCLYTTILKNNPNDLPINSNPFPGFWQSYIEKRREWRITVVGNHFFDATIYTSEKAKDDWRRPEVFDDVTYKKEDFPDTMKDKCLDFLRAFNLRYGAFDFIEDNDGRIIFLECNPNGQYGWLEQILHFPISKTIANTLIEISSNNL